ncbi:MAG TPA: EamA family transporter [Capsulimonadaceae bacterium]|jgi:transporter family protein
MSWVGFALLSALFAGMTALLAKIGVENVPSSLATLIRTVVILIFTVGIVLARGEAHHIRDLSSRTWLFLVLSGIATGLSWLCYFAALKSGPISHVAPIDKLSFVIAVTLGIVFLGEKLSAVATGGVALIVAGVALTLPGAQQWIEGIFSRGPR